MGGELVLRRRCAGAVELRSITHPLQKAQRMGHPDSCPDSWLDSYLDSYLDLWLDGGCR
jgi:hypothetical protein